MCMCVRVCVCVCVCVRVCVNGCVCLCVCVSSTSVGLVSPWPACFASPDGAKKTGAPCTWQKVLPNSIRSLAGDCLACPTRYHQQQHIAAEDCKLAVESHFCFHCTTLQTQHQEQLARMERAIVQNIAGFVKSVEYVAPEKIDHLQVKNA